MKSRDGIGALDRAVRGCESQIRVLLAEDERSQVKIESRMPIVTLISEYEKEIIQSLEVGKDGKTSYERVRGKKVIEAPV